MASKNVLEKYRISSDGTHKWATLSASQFMEVYDADGEGSRYHTLQCNRCD